MNKLCATLAVLARAFVGLSRTKDGQPAHPSKMNALGLILSVVVAAVTLFARAPGGKVDSAGASPHQVITAPSTERQRVMAVAASQLGTQEKTGRNDGEVVKYLLAVGLKSGDPYCAAFIFWCGREALGAKNPFPRSGYAPDMVRSAGWIKGKGTTPEPGDIFGIWFANKGRIAHAGFVEKQKGNSIVTVEANTSPQTASGEADRNGDGVWRKIRPLSTIRSVKRWLP